MFLSLRLRGAPNEGEEVCRYHEDDGLVSSVLKSDRQELYSQSTALIGDVESSRASVSELVCSFQKSIRTDTDQEDEFQLNDLPEEMRRRIESLESKTALLVQTLETSMESALADQECLRSMIAMYSGH